METQTVVAVIVALVIGLAVGALVLGGGTPETVTQTTIVTQTRENTVTVPTTTTVERTVTETVTVTPAPGAGMVGTGEGEGAFNVMLAYSPQVGLYLVDGQGRTLYFFAKDYDGKSRCYDTCAANWPPYYVEKVNPGPGLDPGDFSVVERKDGTLQVTYKGWPLYYFASDEKPGDIMGDVFKNVWFVAKPDYTVLVAVKEGLGTYLVDDRGMTLYYFKNDERDKSNCYGACAANWPPLVTERLVIPSILNASDFRFIVREDGGIQLSYKGWPLYYWVNDRMRGDTTGHGVRDIWSVAFVSGEFMLAEETMGMGSGGSYDYGGGYSG